MTRYPAPVVGESYLMLDIHWLNTFVTLAEVLQPCQSDEGLQPVNIQHGDPFVFHLCAPYAGQCSSTGVLPITLP